MKVLDLRTKPNAKLFIRRPTRGSVLCVDCGWRGWRRIYIELNLHQNFDLATAIHKVKGEKSRDRCPRCHKYEVVYTHVTRGML
jgi:hypothetical protein